MEKLLLERETKVAPTIKEEKHIEEKKEFKQNVCSSYNIKIKRKPPEPQIKNDYIDSFKNKTVGDLKKEQEIKDKQQFEEEKESLIKQQFEKKETNEIVSEDETKLSDNIIEKPNYDLIKENKKVIKIFKEEKVEKKHKSNKKLASIMIACALGVSTVACVTNTVIIDNLDKNLIQIDETYKLNLAKYLKDIYNLDVTKKSMEMIETYPEELLDAGDLGKKSNWFDRFCNFLGGMFGG